MSLVSSAAIFAVSEAEDIVITVETRLVQLKYFDDSGKFEYRK